MQASIQTPFTEAPFPATGSAAKVCAPASALASRINPGLTLGGANYAGQFPLGELLAAGNAAAFWYMPGLGQAAPFNRAGERGVF